MMITDWEKDHFQSICWTERELFLPFYFEILLDFRIQLGLGISEFQKFHKYNCMCSFPEVETEVSICINFES